MTIRTLGIFLLAGFFLVGALINPIWSQPVQAQNKIGSPVEPLQAIAFTEVLSKSASLLNKSEKVSVDQPQPTYVKGLYMTYSAAGHEGLRNHALDLIDTTELNALVVDIKGDKGLLTYKSEVPTATLIGANDAPTIRDWRAFMQEMEERNIYTIARIVVFKDNYLARAHPEWAVKTDTGELWLDREGLPWLEPFQEGAWDYNIALAVEAAERGFDEIQFDYIRFPTDGQLSNIIYSRPIDQPEVRKAAINGLLAKADQALEPYQAKLAVDVFGYTTWYRGDFRIGQDLSEMAVYLDVLSPMLYPSTYDHGLDGMPQYDFAIEFPYEIVYESMMRAMARVKTINPDIIVRPWIQDFPDYGFDRRTYTADEVREQMFAVYDSGGGGWMLWDPRVKYTPEALVTEDVHYPPNEQGEVLVLRYETLGHSNEGAQRSAQSFRQDLERLWAAGFYPVNLRDLAVGNPEYKQDLDQLRQNGWGAIKSDELLARRINYVPRGKRPIALTFDGSHISQFRLLEDGTIDPNSAVGVLKAFHDEHPADWPLRATFFVQPQATEPEYRLFGQPELAEQKLQTLVEWGMEIGSYTLNAVDLSQTDQEELRRQLSSETLIKAHLSGYEIEALALPGGRHPQFESLLRRGTYDNLRYDYSVVVTEDEQPVPSPQVETFAPYRIPRIQATEPAVRDWIEFYQNAPELYYVSAGSIPHTMPTQ